MMKKKLNRTMAKGWTIITASFCFLICKGRYDSGFLAIFMILVFVGIGYILLMTNNCYVETEEMSETEKKKLQKKEEMEDGIL